MNDKVEIRRATVDDLEELFSLQRQLGAVYHSDSYYDERKIAFLDHFRNILDNPNFYVSLALQNSKPCGFLVGTQYPFWWDYESTAFWLEALVVDQSMRGSGIGSALVNEFEIFVRNSGGREIILNSNFKRTEAHRFYEKIGYLKAGYRFSKHLT